MLYKLLDKDNVPISISEIVSFFEKINNLFKPALIERIYDFTEYSKKLIELADVIFVKNKNDGIIGFTAFYANNHETKTAYITLVVVDSKFQGYGISRLMINRCVDKCKNKNMDFIDLHTNSQNYKAIKIYESLGFKKLSCSCDGRVYYRLTI